MNRVAFFSLSALMLLSACSRPQPGPDKTIAGTALGAAWGAGAGAIIGHQVSYAGEGLGIGAGFGAIGGAMEGYEYDEIERTQIEHQETLASLRLQNQANLRSLEQVQYKLDHSLGQDQGNVFYQVFFDPDSTSLKAGAIGNLEAIGEAIKSSARVRTVFVIGHSDDSGTPDYNKRLAEARARAVSSYLAARGISLDRINVQSYGSERPVASNGSSVGRQLNRRVDVYVG